MYVKNRCVMGWEFGMPTMIQHSAWVHILAPCTLDSRFLITHAQGGSRGRFKQLEEVSATHCLNSHVTCAQEVLDTSEANQLT